MPVVRAVRDNNPGNLEAGAGWKGLLPRARVNAAQQTEHRFAVFASPVWGFRALAVVLRNYQRRHGLNTIGKIITRFAPPGENDTQSYIRAVGRSMGMAPDEPLDLENPGTLAALCKAIAMHESGGWLFCDHDLASGIALA